MSPVPHIFVSEVDHLNLCPLAKVLVVGWELVYLRISDFEHFTVHQTQNQRNGHFTLLTE